MKTFYVAFISGDLDKRYRVYNIEQLIYLINDFQKSKYDKNLVVKEYNVENECETCVVCLGKNILELKKDN